MTDRQSKIQNPKSKIAAARPHDMGGRPGAGPIDRTEHHLEDWETVADAINQVLGIKGIKRTDEMRRAREDMDSAQYESLAYYERWVASMEIILTEKGILSREEIDGKVAEFGRRWGEP